jgi:hypothetical protein
MLKEEITIWNLPDKKVYLKIKESVRIKFFKKAIISSGSMVKLTKSLNLGSHDSIRGYLYGYYFVPLWIIKELLNRLPEKNRHAFTTEIENNIEEIKTPCGKSIKNPLPIRFSSTIAKIAGHLVGDGGIRLKNESYTVRYANNSFFLIKKFKEDMKRIFPEADFCLYQRKKDREEPTWNISFHSIIGVILTNLFGPLEGDAKHVPDIILNSNKESKASFLRALFDDEATSPVSHCIRLEMANRNVVENARNMLFEFGIRPGKMKEINDPHSKKLKYNFNISGFYDLRTFNNQIGFDFPEKGKKLKDMIKGYKHIQYKPGEIKPLIINTLNKKTELSLYELAKELDRKPTAKFRRNVLTLEKESILKSRIVKNRLKIYSINTNLVRCL